MAEQPKSAPPPKPSGDPGKIKTEPVVRTPPQGGDPGRIRTGALPFSEQPLRERDVERR